MSPAKMVFWAGPALIIAMLTLADVGAPSLGLYIGCGVGILAGLGLVTVGQKMDEAESTRRMEADLAARRAGRDS